jgi:Chalcone-flavanone isomerase
MLTTLLLAATVCTGDLAALPVKTDFPSELRTPAGIQLLTGTGVRTRTVFKVKVYTFGLYVDAEGARKALAPWRGKSAATLSAEPSVYHELLKGAFSMTMRLVMSRDVSAAQMTEAFAEALGPRVAQAAQRDMPGGAEALARFRAAFTTPLTRGTELLFTWSSDDRLLVSIGGQQVAAIDNRALAWALFDVYLGADPISPEGKRSVIARLPEVLGN